MYLYCIMAVYACMQGCIGCLNTLVEWNNMFESKGLIMLGLNILKRMWFTNYRAWKYEYESDCVRVVFELEYDL